MSTALLLLLLQYAPSASMHLVDTAEVASLTGRLERLETELEKMPGEGVVSVLGMLVALAALLPLAVGIIATIVGVATANSRSRARLPLEQQLERLRGQPAGPDWGGDEFEL